jgi:dihydroneopterin aldolase / 2-amino-4-hydroxy-6-hydroxymethyldihydropteridine diphosphokinase
VDKLILQNLEVFASGGMQAGEDKRGEKFLISAELLLDLKLAGITDRISNTIDSLKLCNELEEVFSKNSRKLMERSAEELATYILLHYDMVRHVSLSLKKPRAPSERNVEYVGVEIEREWREVYIGLGSNRGNRIEYLYSALTALDAGELIRVVDLSSVYETRPVGPEGQGDFLNAVAKIQTLLPPRSLIATLLEREKELGRERSIRWGPRTIDLDILLFGDLITSFEEAVLPHPRLHTRMFVLKPLADIASHVLHPVLGERVVHLFEHLIERGEEEPPRYEEDRLNPFRRGGSDSHSW